MKRILLKLLLFFFYFGSFYQLLPIQVLAAEYNCQVSVSPGNRLTYASTTDINADLHPGDSVNVSFQIQNASPSYQNSVTESQVAMCNENVNGAFYCNGQDYYYFPQSALSISGNSVNLNIPSEFLDEDADFTFVLQGKTPTNSNFSDMCGPHTSALVIDRVNSGAFSCSQVSITANDTGTRSITPNTTAINISIPSSAVGDENEYQVRYNLTSGGRLSSFRKSSMGSTWTGSIPITATNAPSGTIYVENLAPRPPQEVCSIPVEFNFEEDEGEIGEPETNHEPLPYDYCAQVPAEQQASCEACVGDDPSNSEKIYTAVGCINTNQQGLAADLIKLLLGIAGGVALLSILAAAFIFTTSQGEANKVKQAKELMTAAVSGLLFIIFSVIILDFIGVKILQIPGLG